MTNYIHPLHQHAIKHASAQQTQPKGQSKTSFSDILNDLTKLKISKHAKQRMLDRNIHIDNEKWQLISDKVFEAKAKGVTDALVVVDEAILIVSAKNNTVVTALNKADAQEKIFTNINGTILL